MKSVVDRLLRRRLRVTGQVQGVGFRPFAFRLARRLGLGGAVRNEPSGVRLEVVGTEAELDDLELRIAAGGPPLARVVGIERVGEESARKRGVFRIAESLGEGAAAPRATVDAATCADCRREIFDSGDRRRGHPFANCTSCGPRYTILEDLPYDRERTTMAGFDLCPRCREEYGDPGDRRHHAQPVCCPGCGPRLSLAGPDGAPRAGDAIREAARCLRQGGIVALKGLGGWQLAVLATDEAAVARLRERKGREAKPLAVMVADLDAARRYGRLSAEAERALSSPAAPIVLVPPREPLPAVVSGASGRVGLLLPVTPLHHLLAAEAGGPLVLTSGNRSGGPLQFEDDAALRALRGIADLFLGHDRSIARPADDSVVLDGPLGIVPVRRARGFVPTPVTLSVRAPADGFAVGGDRKAAPALARGTEAIPGPHLGDAEDPRVLDRIARTLEDLERLCRARAEWVAHDLHPGYHGTLLAREIARRRGIVAIPVAHHHAHLASLLAERGRAGPIVGLVLDGAGHGPDGTTWGGEVLVGDLRAFARVGHLRPLRLPGGDAAAVETTRTALAWLADLLGPEAAAHPAAKPVEPDGARREAFVRMALDGRHAPPSTGAGRLFDAAAALLGICGRNRFEGMAPLALTAAAERGAAAAAGGGFAAEGLVPLTGDGPFELDHRPLLVRLLDGLARGEAAPDLALLFHAELADGLARAALRAVDETGLRTVGMTGGVFVNPVLISMLEERLAAAGIETLFHREMPPGDGGLALGQVAVAAARLAAGEEVAPCA